MARDSRKTDEIEKLRGLLRQQRSEIKHLKRQLAHGNKQVTKVSNLIEEFKGGEDLDNDNDSQVEPAKKCPKCNNPLKTFDLGIRLLYTCNNGSCNNRFSLPKKIIKD